MRVRQFHCCVIGPFANLILRSLNVGIYEANISSCRAFEKCGFELEGVLRNEVVCDGQRIEYLAVWPLTQFMDP